MRTAGAIGGVGELRAVPATSPASPERQYTHEYDTQAPLNCRRAASPLPKRCPARTPPLASIPIHPIANSLPRARTRLFYSSSSELRLGLGFWFGFVFHSSSSVKYIAP